MTEQATWLTYMSLVGDNPSLPMTAAANEAEWAAVFQKAFGLGIPQPSQGDLLSKAIAAVAAYDRFAAIRFVLSEGCSGDPGDFVDSCVAREAARAG